MIQLNEMKMEIKSGVVFSACAFILSILAGLAGDIPVSVMLFRTLIIIPFFFAAGFAVVYVIRRYVPEIYDVIGTLKPTENAPAEKEKKVTLADMSEITDVSGSTEGVESVAGADQMEAKFTEFTEKDYERLQSVSDVGLDSIPDTSSGKMGKHIITEDQFNNYEPKVIAQAIRTMMVKDKD